MLCSNETNDPYDATEDHSAAEEPASVVSVDKSSGEEQLAAANYIRWDCQQ